jgi:hypothetical protein
MVCVLKWKKIPRRMTLVKIREVADIRQQY